MPAPIQRSCAALFPALSILLGAAASCGSSATPMVPAPPAVNGPEDPEAALDCPGYKNNKDFTDALFDGNVLPAKLSPCFPLDVALPLKGKLTNPDTREAGIDQLDRFAWQLFISLSWPVEKREDKLVFAPRLAGQGHPRWYAWNTTDEVFNEQGGEPEPWEAASDNALESVIRTSTEKQPDGNVLWDQYGKAVGFEIMMNKRAYHNIVKHELYTVGGQDKETGKKPELFGWGAFAPPTLGAAVIKLAWKELSDKDEADRFFTREVKRNQHDPELRRFGLVGMHIAFKSSTLNPRWAWATFEHIDNVADADSDACADPALRPHKPLFYDPLCGPKDCPQNDPRSVNPRYQWKSTQVVREIPIRPGTADFNCQVRALLHTQAPTSPAKYYKLVVAQSAVSKGFGEDTKYVYIPEHAANTMLETYQQRFAGGCVACHQNAPLKSKQEPSGDVVDRKGAGDFMFMLTQRLQPGR